MYGNKRRINTTIIGIRDKGINYTLAFFAEENIKEVVFKTDNIFQKLSKKGNSFHLHLSAKELKNKPAVFGYKMLIRRKDNTSSEITGQVILKR